MENHDLAEEHVVIALARERARAGDGSGGRQQAEGLFQELLAGRWAIVEAFEDGGRRCLLFRRSGSPGQGHRVALTERQRKVAFRASLGHSGKRIAHELGLSESTVSGHMSRAATKLGLHSRVELVRTLAALSALANGCAARV